MNKKESMMAGRLQGKTAIVTGAATGIGEAIAKKFAYEGAQVVVNSLPGDPINDVVSSITADGGEAIGFGGDVSDEVQAIGCVQAALDAFGKIDVLVNNAGVFQETGPTEDFSIEGF